MDSDNKTENFWTFIGKRLNAEAALADWRLMLGDKLDFDKMQRQYLAPNGKMARAIMCAEACSPSCGFRKVCEWEGKYEAVCREWPLKSYDIEKADALFFTVNPSGLLPEIAKIFKITPFIDEFNNENDTWKLGVVPVPGQKTATVYLTLKSWDHDIMDLVFRLNSEERRPYILLVTARKVIHGTSEKVLNDMGSAFVPLDEVLDFNANTDFELLRECSLPQLIAPSIVEVEPEPDNIFRKCGDAWEVRFDGGEKFMLTNCSTGAAYLHFMLERPNVSTPVTEILRGIFGESDISTSIEQLDDDNISCGYRLSDLPDGQFEVLGDGTALKQYCHELKILKKNIIQAETVGDNITREQLQQDFKNLQVEVRKIVSDSGQRKGFLNQVKNVANACRGAINFTINKIDTYDSELAKYLRITIKGGRNPGYFPSDIRDWVL